MLKSALLACLVLMAGLGCAQHDVERSLGESEVVSKEQETGGGGHCKLLGPPGTHAGLRAVMRSSLVCPAAHVTPAGVCQLLSSSTKSGSGLLLAQPALTIRA